MEREVNTPEWWDMKGAKYVGKNDMRNRPDEFKMAAQWCIGPVLEIGPALGEFSNYLPDYVQYVGLDCSDYLVEKARERHKSRLFLRGSVLKLGDHWEKAFETTVAFQVLEHFTKPDFEEALRRIVMVTRKRVLLGVPRGMPSPSSRKNDGHLIGWKNDEAFEKDISKYGEVEFFKGAENHICAILHLP